MSQQEGYVRWAANAKIPLTLALVDDTGAPVLGASPQVSIRRHRETAGQALDNWFWDGAGFIATPVWWPMAAVDAVASPGLYEYIFDQDMVGLEWEYLVYFRNLAVPLGFAVETHIITNEIYIPRTQPDPIIIGSGSLMGELEIIKGLLHHNAMLDKQVYHGGQLVSARLRMFDHPSMIPANPDGNETAGKIAEFEINSAYQQGKNSSFTLKRIFP